MVSQVGDRCNICEGRNRSYGLLERPFCEAGKQKLQYPVRILEFLVGAGGLREPRCIRSPGRGSQRLHRALGGTRILLAAAPTAPPCFCRWQRSSLLLFESTRLALRIFCKTETPVPGSDTGVLGGRGWIRTTEAESSRFTVCPHWPLGNTPIFFFAVLRAACICYH